MIRSLFLSFVPFGADPPHTNSSDKSQRNDVFCCDALMLRRMLRLLSFLMIAVLGCSLSAQANANEGVVEAITSWVARGQIYPTGEQEATFVGVLSGALYIRGGDGSLDTGPMTCPGQIVINTDDGRQTAHGKCVVVTPEGQRIFAEFSCHGSVGQGCKGDFRLTGGTGDMKGITGGGQIQFLSTFTRMSGFLGNIIERETLGIAIVSRLSYKIP